MGQKRPPLPEGRPPSPRRKGKKTKPHLDIFQLDTSSKSLSALSRKIPSDEEVAATLASLSLLDHRATAIIGATYVEHALKRAILAHCPPFRNEDEEALFGDGPSATLGSFSAKINVGIALDIYGPNTKDDLDCVRKIRNAFAHSMVKMDFNTAEVAAECSKFKLVEKWKDYFTPSAVHSLAEALRGVYSVKRYSRLCVLLWHALGVIADEKGKSRMFTRHISPLMGIQRALP